METISESDLFEEICHAVYTVKIIELGGVRKRVIELYKRMGCATVALMCKAVSGRTEILMEKQWNDRGANQEGDTGFYVPGLCFDKRKEGRLP